MPYRLIASCLGPSHLSLSTSPATVSSLSLNAIAVLSTPIIFLTTLPCKSFPLWRSLPISVSSSVRNFCRSEARARRSLSRSLLSLDTSSFREATSSFHLASEASRACNEEVSQVYRSVHLVPSSFACASSPASRKPSRPPHPSSPSAHARRPLFPTPQSSSTLQTRYRAVSRKRGGAGAGY